MQFSATGKQISEQLEARITESVQDHSYYVQQLCYLVWLATVKKVTSEGIVNSIDDLLAQNTCLNRKGIN